MPRRKASFQKIYDPCDPKAAPESVTQKGNAVIIAWSEDETPHIIKSAWLLANAYDTLRVSPEAPVLLLWDHALDHQAAGDDPLAQRPGGLAR